jgi:hypothetical protein
MRSGVRTRKPSLIMETIPASVSACNRRCGGSATETARSTHAAAVSRGADGTAIQARSAPTHDEGGRLSNNTLPSGHVRHSAAPVLRQVAHERAQPAHGHGDMVQGQRSTSINRHRRHCSGGHGIAAFAPRLTTSTSTDVTRNGSLNPMSSAGPELVKDSAWHVIPPRTLNDATTVTAAPHDRSYRNSLHPRQVVDADDDDDLRFFRLQRSMRGATVL